jgi:hypothetical protein
MIQELDAVVLTHDIEEHGLRTGDIGAVVLSHGGGDAFEVEFVTGGGRTVAVLTLRAQEVRPMQAQEILHARGLAA